MRNSTLLLACGLMTGCASTLSTPVQPGSPHGADSAAILYEIRSAAPVEASFEPGAEFTAEPAMPAEYLPAMTATAAPASLKEDGGLHGSRFTIKGGTWTESDASELGDGLVFNASWMRYFTSLLAMEFELGYIDSDGSSRGVNGDIWAIPIMVNGRLNLPIWVIDFYAGLGVGTLYYDAKIGSTKADGFVLAGNAFLGGTVNVADSVALGLEVKYYATEEVSKLNSNLDAVAVMITLGFSR